MNTFKSIVNRVRKAPSRPPVPDQEYFDYIPGLPVEIPVYEIFPKLDETDKFVLARVSRAYRKMFGSVKLDYNPLEYFVKKGSIGLVKWELEHSYASELTEKVFLEACKNGNADLVRYLFQRNCPMAVEQCIMAAIESGKAGIVKFFVDSGFEISKEMIEKASALKKTRVLEVLVSAGKIPSEMNALALVAPTANLNLIKEVYKKKMGTVDVEFAGQAGKSGNLEVMKWALSVDCDLNLEPALETATILDDVKILDFVYNHIKEDHGYVGHISFNVGRIALEYGKFNSLKWADELLQHNYGTYWWERAAERGNLDLMKYGFDKKVDLTYIMYENALSSGNVALVKWLEEKNCPIHGSVRNLLFGLSDTKHTDMVRHLMSKGATKNDFPYGIDFIVRMGDTKLLDEVVSQIQWKITDTELTLAGERDDLNMFKHIHENYKIEFTYNPFYFLMIKKNLSNDILVYMKKCKASYHTTNVWDAILDRGKFANLTLTDFQMRLMISFGLEFEPDYAIQAAKQMRIDLLDWLYENNCMIDYDALAKISFPKKAKEGKNFRQIALTQWIADHPQKIFPKQKPTAIAKKTSALGKFYPIFSVTITMMILYAIFYFLM